MTKGEKITNRLRCKGCDYLEADFMTEDKVNCRAAGRKVVPILKKDVPRYVDCPHRFKEGNPNLSVRFYYPELHLLNALAIRIRKEPSRSDYEEKMASAEAVLQENIIISQRINKG